MEPAASSTGWGSLAGSTLSSPAVTGIFGSRIDVVVRGSDNGIYHKCWTGASWSSWICLATWGATYDQPAVAIGSTFLGDDYLHVVVRGSDNGIYHRKFKLPSGPWDSSWTNVGGATLSTPALLLIEDLALFLFVRGADNGIYCKYWVNSWSSWIRVPGATNDIPAIATLAGYLHLVVRGTDNGIYHNTADPDYPASWSGWTRIPGSTSSAPTLEPVTSPSNYLNLVVRGMDNGIYYNRWSSGVWAGWVNLGGATIDRGALWAYTTTLYLIVRGMDNGIYQKAMGLSSPYTWTAWTQIPGATSSGPTAEIGVICVRGMDNGIYYRFI